MHVLGRIEGSTYNKHVLYLKFFWSGGQHILPWKITWWAPARTEGGVGREEEGSRELIQNSWREEGGGWEEEGGRGGPSVTCVSVFWNVCGALLSVHTGWRRNRWRRERNTAPCPQTEFTTRQARESREVTEIKQRHPIHNFVNHLVLSSFAFSFIFCSCLFFFKEIIFGLLYQCLEQ